MEIILLERVERLGQMGDVVTVKAGYARNFLLPGGKALRATKTNRERFEKQRGQLETQNLERRSEAEAVAARMDGQAIVLIRQAGENGQLYGSVTARDIGDGLTAAGFSVARRQVLIDHPIKELGLHAVQIMLHPEVSVTVKANVAQSEESAASQAASGGRREAAVAEDGQLADAAPPTEPAAPEKVDKDKKDKAD